MAVTTLASSLVPLQLSSDAGTTYLTVVCRKSWSFDIDTPITEEDTDCGVILALGTPKWGFDVEGIMNTTPGSGTEASVELMLGYANSKTSLLVRMQYPISGSPGTDIYAQGAAYLTNLKITGSAPGGLISFTARIAGNGALDIAP